MALTILVPTDRTISGPKLTMVDDTLVVAYDCEGDDGSITEGQITFEDLLSFRYWDCSSCPAENVLGATELRELNQSDYLNAVRARWDESVGWHEWQKDKGGGERYKHFTIYFDDAGSVDVVASRCRVK
jgi:hypothetical protein